MLPKKIKEWLQSENGKKIMRKENFVLLILCGILLMIVAYPTNQDAMPKTQNTEAGIEERMQDAESGLQYCENLEEQLCQLLSCMEGVGACEVMITLAETEESIVLKDGETQQQTDCSSSGMDLSDSNHIHNVENTVFYVDEDGAERPYEIKIRYPKVEGVVVICEGGGNPDTVIAITRIVQALFDVEVHKVRVAAFQNEM